MRAIVYLTAALLLGACSRERVWIELPPSRDARTLIIAVSAPDTPLSVRAIALNGNPGTSSTTISLETSSDVAFEALLYKSTLEALDLTEGELETATGAGRTLPPPDLTYALHLRGSSAAGWTRTPKMSDAVADYRFGTAETAGCLQFDARPYELDTMLHNTFALALDADTALLGTYGGRAYLFVRDTGIVPLDIEPQQTLMAADKGELGDLWFGTDKGELFRGEIRDGKLLLTFIARSTSGEQLHWFSAGTTDDGLELYSLSIEGTFERFRLQQFVSLMKFPPGVPGDWVGGVIRTGPGGALATWAKSARVARADGDSTVEEQTPILGGLGAITHVADLGYVAGTAEGGFIRHDGRTWVVLEGSPFTFAVNAIAPYGTGFVYGGPVGNFGQYVPGYAPSGYCPLTFAAAHWIRYIAVLGEDILLAGTSDGFPLTQVTLLTPRR